MKKFGVVYSTDFHQHYEDCLSLEEAKQEAKELENGFEHDVWIFEKLEWDHNPSGNNYGVIWYTPYHNYYEGGSLSYQNAQNRLEELREDAECQHVYIVKRII